MSSGLGDYQWFASYAATRTIDQIDHIESTEARKCLDTIVRQAAVRALATGHARRACEHYADGEHPMVTPFSAECPILQEWCQPYRHSFAAIPATRARHSASP